VLLTTDPKVRSDFVELGRKRARDFSWDKAAERTLEVYAEALAAGVHKPAAGSRRPE